MFGRKGGRAAEKNAKVWLLGNDHPAADRSLKWDGGFGNLSDPDVLIADLTALTEQVLRRIDKTKLDQALKSITDKLFHGGTIVVITRPEFSTLSSRPLAGRPDSPFGGPLRDPYRYSNYHILPAAISTRKVPPGTEIRAGDGHPFKEYIDAVESFDFLIGVDGDRLPLGPTGAREAGLCRVPGWDITDNSGHSLGLALAALDLDRRRNSQGAYGQGRLVLLPPPTEPIGEAIGKILSIYKGSAPPVEAPPAWAGQLRSERADQVQAQIDLLEGQKSKIDGQIANLGRQKSEMLVHRRLLYAKGAELESSVADALRAIGFAEARQMGKSDQADCIIDVNAGGYQHGLVEVKGADGRTGENDISQCVKWVEKMHSREKGWSKPIFVSNQCRKKDYPASRRDRLWFEKNEIEYAKVRHVCIIPSCVLFEAVEMALDGEAPNRAETAARIASTEGVLERVF